MRSHARALTVASLAAISLAVPFACREAQDSIRPDSQVIPAPDPNAGPHDVPPAAERAALGSSHVGSGPPPKDTSPQALQSEADAKLAVNAAIADGKAHANHADAGVPMADAGTPGPAGKPSGAAEAPGASGAVAGSHTIEGDHATLVFAASTAGQVVPCGCSPDMRGGLPRAAGLLAQWRAEDPTLAFIDAGDLLFAGDKAPSGSLAAQAELKARALAKGAELLSAQARIVGARDLAMGEGFATETAGKVPLLDAGQPFQGSRASILLHVGKAQVPVGVFAAGLSADSAATISARAAQLKKDGARIVVLVLHPRGDRAVTAAQTLLPAARAAGVDLVILGRRDDPALDPDMAESGTPPMLRMEGHGQTLLRVDLTLPKSPTAPLFLSRGAAGRTEDADALGMRIGLMKERLAGAPDAMKPMLQQKIDELLARQKQTLSAPEEIPAGAPLAEARFVKLTQEIPDDPEAKALVAGLDAQVAARNLELAKKEPEACPAPKKGEEFFIGVSQPVAKKGQACATCHQTEAAFWVRTPHASAYQVLVDAKKQFSLDCIRCHVTGWQQPGGVCRIDKTAVGGPGLDDKGAIATHDSSGLHGVGRQDVQCEMCHAMSSTHALTRANKDEEVPESTCVRCHEAENSPHFDYRKYRKWIIGPGHGRPLPKGETPRSLGEIAAGNLDGPNAELKRAHGGAGK
ncbi:MAG: hypothetical protein JST92_24785 [Deltaproteobacteria bacterium]|nr:hypothetical protein [Deltaproteobacteria bacterium]